VGLRSLGAFCTQKVKFASGNSLWFRWSYSTKLQQFFQPPPRSSAGRGGFHFHAQLNCTDGLPPVVESPINETFGLFLWRFGSAWSSRVTRLSSSRKVGAKRKVRPLIEVSTGAPVAPLFAGCEASICRRTNVKLKFRSSSLGRRRRKEGGVFRPLSGSCSRC
jgi:hypothetical protein